MHRRLASTTLSQLAFPGEGNPIFPWEKSHWDNAVVKSKIKIKSKNRTKQNNNNNKKNQTTHPVISCHDIIEEWFTRAKANTHSVQGQCCGLDGAVAAVADVDFGRYVLPLREASVRQL